MMDTLQALRLIQKKEYGRIQLTELGREMGIRLFADITRKWFQFSTAC